MIAPNVVEVCRPGASAVAAESGAAIAAVSASAASDTRSSQRSAVV
jgi:hypothetical protein